MCTRVKLHFTSRKLTHHLGKLATNYVSKALKSDLRFSFLPESGIKKSTGRQRCPLSPPPPRVTCFLQLSFWVSSWDFWPGRREGSGPPEGQGSRRNRGRRRGVQQPRSSFMHKDLQNLLHGTWGESWFCPRPVDPESESWEPGSGAKGCWGKETSMEPCIEPIPEAHWSLPL